MANQQLQVYSTTEAVECLSFAYLATRDTLQWMETAIAKCQKTTSGALPAKQ